MVKAVLRSICASAFEAAGRVKFCKKKRGSKAEQAQIDLPQTHTWAGACMLHCKVLENSMLIVSQLSSSNIVLSQLRQHPCDNTRAIPGCASGPPPGWQHRPQKDIIRHNLNILIELIYYCHMLYVRKSRAPQQLMPRPQGLAGQPWPRPSAESRSLPARLWAPGSSLPAPRQHPAGPAPVLPTACEQRKLLSAVNPKP